ncbi:hypothetical protein [Terrabacter terrae]|uniref:hypothetical protein n=1 Tax=Terrabacter terrae TaxID=318434 RepID=UPI0031E11552
MYAHDDDNYPDESRWVPGEAGTPSEVFAGSYLHIQLERARAYPNGVIVTLTVRAGALAGREAQRAFAGEVLSFRSGDLAGPRLERVIGSGEVHSVDPWGHGGSGGIYSLPYWIPFRDETGAPLSLRFSWAGRGVEHEFEYSAGELQRAHAASRQVIS